MKKMLFYKCFLTLTLLSCNSKQVLKLSENNMLDIHKLNSLETLDNKKYIISKSNENCIEISSKEKYDIAKYCLNYSLDKKENTYSENKSYLSEYAGLNCVITERNTYNASGNLIHSEKLLTELYPKINSSFSLPLQNMFLKNEKYLETKNFEYIISFRDVLIQAMKIYLTDLDKQIHRLPDVYKYEGYQILYENQKLIITPDNGNVNFNDVANALLKMNLKMDIDKDFEENQWRVHFNKKGKTYILNIDEDTRTTSIEVNKNEFY